MTVKVKVTLSPPHIETLLTFRRVDFKNTATAIDGWSNGSGKIVVTSSTFDNSVGTGIYLGTQLTDGLYITNSTFGCTSYCIQTQSAGTTINFGTIEINGNNFSSAYGPIIIASTNNITSTHILIHDNTFQGSQTAFSIILKNIASSDVKVYGNVSTVSNQGLIQVISESINNLKIYGNTLTTTSASASNLIWVQAAGTGVEIYNNTLTPAHSTAVVTGIDEFNPDVKNITATADHNLGDIDGNKYLDQSVTMTNNNNTSYSRLANMTFYLKKSGSPLGTITVSAYTDDAGNLGSLVETSSYTLSASNLTTSYQGTRFIFGSHSQLTRGAKYHFVLHYNGTSDASNYVKLQMNVAYANKVKSSSNGTTWTDEAPNSLLFSFETGAFSMIEPKIYNNTFTSYSDTNTDHMLQVGATTGGIVYGNHITGGGIGILFKNTIPSTNSIAYNNIIFTSVGTQQAIRSKGANGVTFFNNTVVVQDALSSPIWIDYDMDIGTWNPLPSQNIVVKNSILYRTAVSNSFHVYVTDTTDINDTIDYNLVYSGANTDINNYFSSWSAWQIAGYDIHGTNTDPLLVNTTNNFNLQPLSPAIDSGTTTSAMTSTSTDFAGNPIYGTPDIGAYEYQPPHSLIIATPDTIDVGAGARIYANGKFRDLTTTNSVPAHLKVTPSGGSFTVYDAITTRPAYLDITNITNWTNTHKTWTEGNAQTSNMVTDHTIGDLNNNTYYTINVTGASASNISGINGTTCVNAVCQSNSSGTLSFEYNGGYSTHTFDIVLADITPPVTTATPAGGTYGASRDVTLSCLDDLSGCNHTYYTTDGTTPTTGSAIYSTPITISADTTLKFFSTDLADNPETPKTETYVIDSTYPVTDITSHPSATTNSTSATFVFSANKESTFECKLDSASYASCTSPKDYTSLAEGSHTFTVEATDTLSHTEPSPPSFTWVVDTLAPSSVGVPSFGTITSVSIVVVKPATVTETGSGLYQWQVRKNSTTELGLNNISTTSITDSALLENTQYTYDVQFSDNATNVSSYGTPASKYTLVDIPTNLSASSDSNSVSLTVDSFPNDTSDSSGYYFSRSEANSGWIQTNSWTDTGLSCGNSYDYSVIYRNGDGTETSSISTSQSTSGCSHGGGRVFITPPVIIPTVNPTNILGCDSNTGFSITTGQSCLGNTGGVTNTIPLTLQPQIISYNFGTTTLKFWSKGEAVKQLQMFLNNVFNFNLKIDGIYGLKTMTLVRQWQKANGLVVDGLVGIKTKAKMNAVGK